MSQPALKAPFPYFGGKSRVAPVVWAAFGDVRNYVEPFCGSLAMLLGRPTEHLAAQPIETVNDADGLLANFWRSMVIDPDGVIAAAENPVNECDLHARHLWLLGERVRITERLMGDPVFCDPKAAGWWVWGLCCWIGGGWCSGDGPWQSVDGVLTHVSNAGQGVNRKLPHVSNAGQGVNRQLPHVGNAGQGVNRKLPHVGDAGRGVTRQRYWLETLVERIRNVRVACGDWSRVCGAAASGASVGVFFDPPYSVGSELYAPGKTDVRNDVRAWCIENQVRPGLRIALCGYDGEHDLPGWTIHEWKASGGYSSRNSENQNCKRERIWLSPNCLPVERQLSL